MNMKDQITKHSYRKTSTSYTISYVLSADFMDLRMAYGIWLVAASYTISYVLSADFMDLRMAYGLRRPVPGSRFSASPQFLQLRFMA